MADESFDSSICCDTWSKSWSATVSSASIELFDGSDTRDDSSSNARTRDNRAVLSPVVRESRDGPAGASTPSITLSSLRSA